MSLASSLNVGVSALRAYSEGIQTVSNNIANVNTVGYKASHAQYADTFSNILRPMVPNEKGDAAKIAPTQVGGGVQVESVAPVFSQGTIQITNSNSDLAIAGNGFFLVKNPQTQQLFVTRAGNFRVDASGALVTQQGYRVQGSLNASTEVVYDKTTGAYNVKGPQDNYKVTIPPPASSTTATGFASSAAGDRTLTISGLLPKGLATGMPISSGDLLAPGTIISEIHQGTSTTPSSIVLSKNPLNQITAGVVFSLGAKSIDSQSHTLVLPVDYNRPDLVKGMPMIGSAFKPGTTIADPGSTGNIKVMIPDSPSIVAGISAVADTSVLLTSVLPAAGPVFGSTEFNKAPAPLVNNRLVVPSIAGITKGMVISNVGGPLDLAIISNMGTTPAVVADPAAVPPVIAKAAYAWIEVIKKDTSTLGYSALDVTTPAFTATSTSSFSVSGRKTLDKLSDSISISATDARYLTPTTGTGVSRVLGDPVSGQGIPVGTFVGTITSDPVTGLKNISLVDVNGSPVTPTSDSYGSVQLAFKNQVITISDFPVTDSYTNVTVSLGNAYRPAAAVGDIRISFNEYDQMTLPDAAIPPDYTFVGTDGKPLDGITLQAARASSPKIRTFNIGTSGDINVVLSNGQTFTAGAVLLQMFKDPGALTREGDNLFTGLYTAGPYNGKFESSNIAALTPSNGGLGAINGGALELSNVDLGEEFSTMIITQRAFQAGSRVITTTDQMMEEAVNLKR